MAKSKQLETEISISLPNLGRLIPVAWMILIAGQNFSDAIFTTFRNGLSNVLSSPDLFATVLTSVAVAGADLILATVLNFFLGNPIGKIKLNSH